jgi:hypothetical protein
LASSKFERLLAAALDSASGDVMVFSLPRSGPGLPFESAVIFVLHQGKDEDEASEDGQAADDLEDVLHGFHACTSSGFR